MRVPMNDEIPRVDRLTDEDYDRARHYVATHAEDAEDAKLLMLMLGLLEVTTEGEEA